MYHYDLNLKSNYKIDIDNYKFELLIISNFFLVLSSSNKC